jgi:hypothetical protein
MGAGVCSGEAAAFVMIRSREGRGKTVTGEEGLYRLFGSVWAA